MKKDLAIASRHFYIRQKKISKENQNKILHSLQCHYPENMSTKELTDDTGLNKDTIFKHGKELIEKRLVFRKGNGKFAKYQLTQLALGNVPQTRGYILESIGYEKILRNTIFKREKKLATKELTAFSTKIGAYITYVMIESMRPNGFNGLINGNNKILSGKIRDNLVKEWVKGAIHPERILWEFTTKLHIVQEGLRHYNVKPHSDNNNNNDDDTKWRFYEFDNEIIFRQLRRTFKTLYPDIFKELEYVRTRQVPAIIKDRLKTLQGRSKNQKQKPK